MVPKSAVESVIPDVVGVRHDLHAHPELMYEEVRTSKVVQTELAKAGIEFVAGLAGGTGVLGYIPATDPQTESCIGLRADMDALPILEDTGRPYSSTTPGKMHACGHDGHTSILIGAARVLAELPERPNHIMLVFQPAEEGGAGGKRMVEDGCLTGKLLGKPVEMMFGLHGWTTVGVNRVATREGALMAATDEFSITIHGKGGHAAAPSTACDPILIAAHLTTALQTIASRNVDPFDSIVVTVGMINAGTATNIIPMTAELRGTMRTLSAETRKLGEERIRAISDGVSQAFGATAEVSWKEGYPVTFNHKDATERFFRVAEQSLGAERVEEGLPTMGGEDFSYYGYEVPACFFQLGLIPEGQDTYPSVHTPFFDFNDHALPTGIQMMCELAVSK